MNKNLKENIPPQALDVEKAVIGGLLIDSSVIEDCLEICRPEMFYDFSHKLIFSAISNLYHQNNNIDLLTVSQELASKNKLEKIGGDFALINLSQKVASTAHIIQHLYIIKQKYIQRELIKNCTNIITQCYKDNDVLELLDEAYDELNRISEHVVKNTIKSFKELKNEVIEHSLKIHHGEIESGLPTPITKLTKASGGWRESELIILAARPGMGKTAFALSCATIISQMNVPTAIFSLETSSKRLVGRILSSEFEIDGNVFTTTGGDEILLGKIDNTLDELPLHIDDTAGLSIQQFQIKAKRLVNKHGVKLIVVDYLQLMTANAGSREQEISKISRGLKMTAMNLNIPIIALSQLSRSVETRGGSKRPLLSDLRESGAIEQDADVVTFLYRPEYYGMTEWDDEDYNLESCIDEAEYIVAKNRNGGLIRNRMKWQGRFTKFSDKETMKPWESNMNDIPKGNPDEAF